MGKGKEDVPPISTKGYGEKGGKMFSTRLTSCFNKHLVQKVCPHRSTTKEEVIPKKRGGDNKIHGHSPPSQTPT
jgi:hypothetical protein